MTSTPTVSIGEPATCTSPNTMPVRIAPPTTPIFSRSTPNTKPRKKNSSHSGATNASSTRVADQRRQRLLVAQVARELLLVGLADDLHVDRGQDPERDEGQDASSRSPTAARSRRSPNDGRRQPARPQPGEQPRGRDQRRVLHQRRRDHQARGAAGGDVAAARLDHGGDHQVGDRGDDEGDEHRRQRRPRRAPGRGCPPAAARRPRGGHDAVGHLGVRVQDGGRTARHRCGLTLRAERRQLGERGDPAHARRRVERPVAVDQHRLQPGGRARRRRRPRGRRRRAAPPRAARPRARARA